MNAETNQSFMIECTNALKNSSRMGKSMVDIVPAVVFLLAYILQVLTI